MRKKRQLFGKNWTDLRAEINKVALDKEFNSEDFRALSIYDEWEEIEK